MEHEKLLYRPEMAKSNIIVSRLLWMLLLPTQEIPTKGSPRMVKEALNDGKGGQGRREGGKGAV